MYVGAIQLVFHAEPGRFSRFPDFVWSSVLERGYLFRQSRSHSSGSALPPFNTMDSHEQRRSRTEETPWLKLLTR